MKDYNFLISKLEKLEKLLTNQAFFTKEVMSLGEACTYLSISKSFAYSLTSNNLLPYSKPGGKMIFFKRSDLNFWALSNPISTQAELDMKASQHVLNAYPFKHNKKAS